MALSLWEADSAVVYRETSGRFIAKFSIFDHETFSKPDTSNMQINTKYI